MDLNWLECLVLGLVAGFADVLPISGQAHKAIFLKMFGAVGEPLLLRLVIHMAVFGALYFCCSNHIRKLLRQLQLNRIPKKKRKRPVDTRVIAEFKVLRVMVIPLILSLFLYTKTAGWGTRLILTSVFLLLNGVILFLPRLLPTGNKDGLSMSVVDSILMGIGGGLGCLPGVSSMGGVLSLASICGSERQFALNLGLLSNLVLTAGLIVLDVAAIVSGNVAVNIPVLVCCAVAGLAAAVGTYLGVRLMRVLAANGGFSAFAYYSFGCALFSFILYLMV